MLSFGAAQLPTAVLPEDDLTNRGDRFCFVHLSIDALSAFSFPSFACSIAGVASGLPLFFHGGFPRGPLSEFHIAGLLLGFQGGLTSGSLGGLGGLCGGQGSSLLSFNGQLGGCSLSDTGIASHPDRVPCRAPLDSGRALGRRPGSGRPFQLGLFRICRGAQAVGKIGVLGPIHLNLIRSR
jgi:hypothetical protein